MLNINPKKPIFAWELDGTFIGEFPSKVEAAIELASSDYCVGESARKWKVIGGKYLASYTNKFPGLPNRVHGKSKPVWAWDTECNLIGEYPSRRRAAKALAVGEQAIQYGLSNNYVVNGKYLFTNLPEPPVLSDRQQKRLKGKDPKVAVPKKPKYVLLEAKWVLIGEFKDVESAAVASGLSPRTVYRIVKSGTVYQKTFRAKMKKRLIVVEKLEWIESTERFVTMADVANRIGLSVDSVSQAIKNGGKVGGKYKVKPIPTVAV